MTHTLIIGGSSLISQWISKTLSSDSRRLIVTSRDKDISTYGDSCDPTIYSDLVREYKHIATDGLTLQSIYYCPGSTHVSDISTSDPNLWAKDIFVNLIGAYNAFRAYIDVNGTSKPIKFIVIGSTAGISNPRQYSSYSISKSALESMITSINNEPPSHIRATCLRLGTCNTQFSSSNKCEDAIGQQEVANCIILLENSRHTNLPDIISLRPIRSL